MRWLSAAVPKAEAQAALGDMYRRGLGVPVDHDVARRWYLLAAEQGLAAAEFALGDVHYQGLGVAMTSIGELESQRDELEERWLELGEQLE